MRCVNHELIGKGVLFYSSVNCTGAPKYPICCTGAFHRWMKQRKGNLQLQH